MKPEETTSFYKLLYNDNFNTLIRLPREFVEKHGEKLSERGKVVAAESGDAFPVRIQRIGEHHFLTDGWSRFARRARLRSCEFLLFKFVGKSTFRVFVFGVNGCSRDLGESDSGDEASSGCGEDNGIFWIVKKLSVDHTFQLEIPRHLATATGIIRNNKLKLKDEKGKKWPVYVTNNRFGKTVMTFGWNEFLTAAKITVGSKLSLEFGGGNAIKVKVVERCSAGELFRCVRSKGRPPRFAD